MNMKLIIQGHRSLQRKFNRMERDAVKVAKTSITEGSEPLARQYRTNFESLSGPDATGKTARRIGTKSAGRQKQGIAARMVGVRGKRAPIAYWFEVGTKRQAPRFPLRQAVQDTESQVVTSVRREFRGGIRRLARR